MNRNFLYLILMLIFASCAQKEFQLETGDLLFIVGKENSDFVNAIKGSTASKAETPFSHVGIVCIENNTTYVLEATSPEGVIKTLLNEYIAKSAVSNNKPIMAVGRLKKEYNYTIADAIEKANLLLGQPYDYAYDENNDSYYCSELIRVAFKDSTNNFLFPALAMSFKNKESGQTEPFWISHYQQLNQPIPEGEPGTNPVDMSKSMQLDMVHYYYD